MKTIQELQQLRDELKLAYETILANPNTDYDRATVAYAKKCYEDAEKALFEPLKAAMDKASEKGLESGTVILCEGDTLEEALNKLTEESEELGINDVD